MPLSLWALVQIVGTAAIVKPASELVTFVSAHVSSAKGTMNSISANNTIQRHLPASEGSARPSRPPLTSATGTRTAAASSSLPATTNMGCRSATATLMKK